MDGLLLRLSGSWWKDKDRKMIFYLRNKNNDNIAEIELTTKDVHGYIYIEGYTQFLLYCLEERGFSEEDISSFISEFKQIQDIRGWYWEMGGHRLSYSAQLDVVRIRMQQVAELYYLSVVED